MQTSGFDAAPVGRGEDDAFEQELRAAPWGYGQYRPPTFEEALWIIRRHGLGVEADVIAAEIAKLKAAR